MSNEEYAAMRARILSQPPKPSYDWQIEKTPCQQARAVVVSWICFVAFFAVVGWLALNDYSLLNLVPDGVWSALASFVHLVGGLFFGIVHNLLN